MKSTKGIKKQGKDRKIEKSKPIKAATQPLTFLSTILISTRTEKKVNLKSFIRVIRDKILIGDVMLYPYNKGIRLKPLIDITKHEDYTSKLIDWKEEIDAGNFIEDFIRYHQSPIYLSYSISNFFFRFCINENEANIPDLIREFSEYINENKEEDENLKEFIMNEGQTTNILLLIITNFFEALIKTIELYPKKLISLSSYFQITDQEVPEYICLYRGFSKDRNQEILDYVEDNLNKTISINAMLSTSIKFITALGFCGDGGIIWRIIINKKSFEKFYYSYISPNHLTIDADTILDPRFEIEFLLNYGIQLRCISKLENQDDITSGNHYTLYTFLFMGYDVHQARSGFRDLIRKKESILTRISDEYI
jgi:hypothetical protein